MSTITYAEVVQHAADLGLYVQTIGNKEDNWWLVASTNWQTTKPGRTLAEIKAELVERDGGAWDRKQAEKQAKTRP